MDYMKLMQSTEPICDELKPFYNAEGVMGLPLCSHPLVHGIYPVPALANHALREKKKMLKRFRKERNWSAILFVCYERPYRLKALADLWCRNRLSNLTCAEFEQLFGDVWSDSENIWQNEVHIHAMLHCYKPRETGPLTGAMSPEDLRELEAMPDTVELFRGCTAINKVGWSWTLDEDKARWFARRFNRPRPLVLSKHASKIDFLFYTNRRDEQEVVIHPDVMFGGVPKPKVTKIQPARGARKA